MAEVLVLDTGGRGRALEQAMQASKEVSRVVVASTVDAGLEQFTVGAPKPLVVLGNEAFAIAGVADGLRDEGYSVLGASQDMAEYEAKKSTAVRMMRAADIDHPRTHISESDREDKEFMTYHDYDTYVIKADEPAEGKGVILPESEEEARLTQAGMRDGSIAMKGGMKIIDFAVKEYGDEVSAIAVVGSNRESFMLTLTQDYKRISEGDKGLNTGGMGAYGPVADFIVDSDAEQEIQEIMDRSLWGMERYGIKYEKAALYAGLMDKKVIEYNVRFGDPETQVQFALFTAAGGDAYRLLASAAEGNLEKPNIDPSKLSLAGICVCLASAGYPRSKSVGDEIYGLDGEYEGVTIQKAAVDAENKTSGGRVLYVTAVGENIDDAAAKAYAAIDLDRIGKESGKIGFPNMQFRRDIGWQARDAA